MAPVPPVGCGRGRRRRQGPRSLPVALPSFPPAALRRGARPGARQPGPAQRGARRPGGPRLPVQRPRGTGKTSTARILAKALNCAALEDGEPCGRCDSCIEIARGSSLDVHELDAASNNGVDAMRDLVSHAALGTPGRWKVYIVDEVHMLSTAASNALLKTLEEPPGHVVFVLATTDAQKVLPTIRSRTQHFEFRLLGPETLVGAAPTSPRRQPASTSPTRPSTPRSAGAGDRPATPCRPSTRWRRAASSTTTSRCWPSWPSPGRARPRPGPRRRGPRHRGRPRHAQRLAGDLAEHLRQAFLAIVAGELVSRARARSAPRSRTLARRMGLPPWCAA